MDNLANSFAESLSEEYIDVCSDIIEAGIDSLMDDGILKDIPFISVAVSVCKIGKNVHDRYQIKKMAAFLDAINNGLADELDREKHKERLLKDKKTSIRELEYVLLIIDRYIGLKKPQMLGKLYLAYLNYIINWEQFSMYAEVIDRFLPRDYWILQNSSEYLSNQNAIDDSHLRLVALGLIVEDTDSKWFENNSKGGYSITSASLSRVQKQERKFFRTSFGETLVEILENK